jgi:hypothetical protein
LAGEIMSDFKQAHKALLSRVLEGEGRASRAQRHGAFANAGLDEPIRTLIGKVAGYADTVTDEDVAAARASGLSEDQIFEMVVAAALGESTRQYDTALAALDAAKDKE